MTSATDNRTTDLLDGLRHVGNLHEFAELFGFDWHDDSDWTWHDVAVKMADDLEQSIAATLGSGTLTAEQVRGTVEKHWHDIPDEYDMREATALPEYSYDWQAIADELNAALDGGECEVVQGKNGPKCSNCGKELPEDPYSDYEGNFCPTCGARIRKAVER